MQGCAEPGARCGAMPSFGKGPCSAPNPPWNWGTATACSELLARCSKQSLQGMLSSIQILAWCCSRKKKKIILFGQIASSRALFYWNHQAWLKSPVSERSRWLHPWSCLHVTFAFMDLLGSSPGGEAQLPNKSHLPGREVRGAPQEPVLPGRGDTGIFCRGFWACPGASILHQSPSM